MMVIVKSFAQHIQYDHNRRLTRLDLFVVRSSAPNVSRRIDQPGDVQRKTVANHTLQKGHRVRFFKQINSSKRRNHKDYQWMQVVVEPENKKRAKKTKKLELRKFKCIMVVERQI